MIISGVRLEVSVFYEKENGRLVCIKTIIIEHF